jgi:XTP/dITP diphosphohydrolase
LLIVLQTSPRVPPGLLSWPAWQALRSAAVVLAPAGHPQLPALDEAGIAYRIADAPGQVPSLAGTGLADAARDAAGQDGTAVWLAPPGAAPVVPPGARLLPGSADLPGAHLIDLVATMDRLRRECPWDTRQTHESLAPYLLEEPYEALDALESGDQEAFREELGDVLLQVAFHARIAAERDDGYDVDDVADGIVAKLVRRHPHVFADVSPATGTTSRSRRSGSGPNGPGRRMPRPIRPPRWTGCRSASPPCRWPRNCSAGPSGRGCQATWRGSTAPPRTRSPMAILGTSAGTCSSW